MIDKDFLDNIVNDKKNKKWKDSFNEREFRIIIMSMYRDYKKLSRSDFEFALYVNAMTSMLDTKTGQDSIRETYLNQNKNG